MVDPLSQHNGRQQAQWQPAESEALQKQAICTDRANQFKQQQSH